MELVQKLLIVNQIDDHICNILYITHVLHVLFIYSFIYL